MDEQTLRPGEVAEILGVSPETLRRWRQDGSGPPFEQLSERTVRYPKAALEAWRAERRTAVG